MHTDLDVADASPMVDASLFIGTLIYVTQMTTFMGRLYSHANCPELATDKNNAAVVTTSSTATNTNNIFMPNRNALPACLKQDLAEHPFATTRYLTDDTSFVVTRC